MHSSSVSELSKRVLAANLLSLSQRKYGKRAIRGVARDAGIGLGTMQRIYAGTTSIGVDVLDRLAEVFEVEPAALLQPGLGAAGYSEMAKSLASSLDEISDPAVRRRVWALCLLVIDQRDLPEATAVPASPPMPGRAPGHR